MLKWRRLLRFAIPLLATISVAVAYSGRLAGDFRTDEPHKIAETYYLRLVERGDFAHRDWFDDLVERSNPVAGKYLFGIAMQLAGSDLPHDISPARATNDGQQQPPPAYEREFRRALAPVRVVSLIATAATAAIVAFVAFDATGAIGAVLAAFFFGINFLAQAFAGTAVFDPILTFFVTATLAVAGTIAFDKERNRAAFVRAVAAGLLGAIAYQIRVSGAIAIAVVCLVVLARSLIAKHVGRGIAICVVIGATAILVGTAMNPFYWARPTDPAVAAEFRETRPLPIRIVTRYERQLSDLSTILDRERKRQKVLATIPEKANFVFQYACGDAAGLLMLLGSLFAIAFVRDLTPPARVALGWSFALTILFTLWIPIGYPRFALLIVPALALAGGIGWATFVAGIGSLIHARRTSRHT